MADSLVFVLVFLITFISSFIHGSIGFGYSVFAMSILPLFLPLHSAAAIVNIALLIITSQIAFQLRKHINYKFIIMPLLMAIVGRTIGVYLLMHLETLFLEKFLGGLLIILSIYMFFFQKKIRIKPSAAKGAALGLTSGLLGGLYNLAGPPLVLYYFPALKDKLVYAASLQATFVITSIFGVAQHFYYGNITSAVIKMASINIAAVIIGGSLGVLVLKKIKKETIGKVVYSYMALMGLFILIRS